MDVAAASCKIVAGMLSLPGCWLRLGSGGWPHLGEDHLVGGGGNGEQEAMLVLAGCCKGDLHDGPGNAFVRFNQDWGWFLSMFSKSVSSPSLSGSRSSWQSWQSWWWWWSFSSWLRKEQRPFAVAAWLLLLPSPTSGVRQAPKISKLTQNIAICSKYYNCPQISQFAQIITICPICLKCTQNITIYSKCSSLLKIPQFALNIIICSISKKITKTHMHCTFPALLHFSQFFLNIWQFLVTSYISYTFHVYSLNTLFIFDKKVNWGLFVDTRNMYIYIWPFRWLRAKNYNV